MNKLMLFGCAALAAEVASAEVDWHGTADEAKATPHWMIESALRAVDTNEVVVANVPRDMKLFLLIGQSNMAGRGTLSAEDKKAIPRCVKLNRDGVWVESTSPLHFDRATAGYGIANTFVRRYLEEHPSDMVGLIPCAVGGSSSVTWSPEEASDPIGTNYRRALQRARLAQKHGQIVGILWHQGEADVKLLKMDASHRDRYVARLAALAAALRSELKCPDAPFLIGEIGTLPRDCTAMNPVLAAAAAAIPNGKLVVASDLKGHLPDGVHFDTPSYKVFGARYYEAWESCVDTRDTGAIQQEIDRAWKAGGGKVVVPSGVHRVGGLRLRSNVELHLASNAVLSASRNCDDFEILADDTLEPVNPQYVKESRGWSVNAPRDRSKPWIASTNYVVRWNNGVIRILNATNVVISGEAGSAIDGNNSYDPDGEERYRGVHGISCFYSSNVVVRGVELRNTGNWATRFAYSDDLEFENLTIRGGHDGVHVRGCDRVRVKDCDIRCGDDCIAGFDNSDVMVEDCRLNTACSAFRFGGTHVRVKRCHAWGPAEWPFRGSLTQEEKRQGVSSQGRGRGNLLSFWTYFADFSQPVRRPQGDIVIEDCTVENADRFLHYNFSGNETWQKGAPLGDIRFERVKATGVGASLCAYASPKRPLTLTLKDCDIAFRKPQPEFVRGAHIGFVTLENLRVTGVVGPCVRSWAGKPEIKSLGCKGLNAETQSATTKFTTRSI